MNPGTNIHGTGLVLGKVGVLLRGPSGSGKSLLALALLDRWAGRGLDAALVSDDRVELSVEGQDLLMKTPEPIAGLIELRGRGLIRRPYRESARLHLVIDLVDEFSRLLEESAFTTDLYDVDISRAPVPKAGLISLEHQVLLVVEAVSVVDAQVVRP